MFLICGGKKKNLSLSSGTTYCSIRKTVVRVFIWVFHLFIYFVDRLQEVSDVAVMQASALQARQNSREKEVQALRRELLDYQVSKLPTRTVKRSSTIFLKSCQGLVFTRGGMFG